MDWTKKSQSPSTAQPKFSAAPKKTVTPRRRKLSEKDIAAQVGEMTALVQHGVLAARPDWSEDALTDAELGMWSKAAAQEIISNATLLNYWQKMEGVSSPHTRLGAVVMLIAVPRLVKHGVMAVELAAPICGLASILVMSDNGVGAILDQPQPVPNRSGSALRNNGENGVGQIPVREPATGPEEIPDFLSDQSGRYQVERGHSIQVSESSPVRDGRPTDLPN